MHILIVEDEIGIADAVSEMLKKENFNTTIITNGEDGEYEALSGIYDLVILDVMLPEKNGFEILKSMRDEKIKTPVIMLTAKSEVSDKLNGLENGADDYVTKPFHARELLARVKAVLKRSNNIEELNILEFENLKLNLDTCQLEYNDKSVEISGKELELLQLLIINKKQIVDRETIINKIWGYDSDAEYNNVEVYITFIRRKLKLLNSNVIIKAVRGIGYKLEVLKDD